MPQKRRYALIPLLICFAGQCLADDQTQSLTSIQQAVVNFLTSKIQHGAGKFEIKVSSLDSRLRLPKCANALESFTQSGGIRNGSASVGVRCRGDKPWTIFTTAVIKQFETIAVTARPLERGAVITPDDIVMETRDVSRINGAYFTGVDQAVNKQAKRPLLAGSVLLDSAVEEIKLVKKGQHVIIVAKSRALDIRMAGEALMDGTAGQRIRVRNEKSKRIVEGVVAAPGMVRVTF